MGHPVYLPTPTYACSAFSLSLSLRSRVVDLRTVLFDVPPQEILSKDSVTVTVDAVVYYKIDNPMAAVCNVSDAATSTQLLASTTLRNVLGTKNLSDILAER